MIYTYYETSDKCSLSLYFDDQDDDIPIVLTPAHPRFYEAKSMMDSGELSEMSSEEVRGILFTSPGIPEDIAPWIDENTDEVRTDVFSGTTINGVYMDEEVAEGIRSILSGFDPNNEDHAEAILNFLRRVENHPTGIASKDFLRWAMRNGINLTRGGMIVGYKSVLKVEPDMYSSTFGVGIRPNGDSLDGLPPAAEGRQVSRPSYRGPGITDGVSYENYIPMYVGAVVEMPRDKVDSRGTVECSVGLHVGNYGYASTFNSGPNVNMCLVLVDPVDIVSVPDYAFDKYRVSRYTIIAEDLPGELDTHYYLGETFSPVVSEPEPEPDLSDEIFENGEDVQSVAGFENDPVVKDMNKESTLTSLIRHLRNIFS